MLWRAIRAYTGPARISVKNAAKADRRMRPDSSGGFYPGDAVTPSLDTDGLVV